MPNFNSEPSTNASVQVGINVKPISVDLYTPASGWILDLPNLLAALEYMRDNTAPISLNGAQNSYTITVTFYPNNAGPWSEQGAGLPGPYNG